MLRHRTPWRVAQEQQPKAAWQIASLPAIVRLAYAVMNAYPSIYKKGQAFYFYAERLT